MKKFINSINKEKLINYFIVFIVVLLYIFVFMYIYSNFRERKRNELTNGIIDKVDEKIVQNKEEQSGENNTSYSDEALEATVKYSGINYTVLGKIEIKKINIYEPILKENTKEAYDTALVKMSGPYLNLRGNVAIGGHNFMKGNYFIKINQLVKDDKITITDLTGKSIDYYVYDYKVTIIDDASYLAQPNNFNDRIITLVTCTKGGKERYYVKAKAK